MRSLGERSEPRRSWMGGDTAPCSSGRALRTVLGQLGLMRYSPHESCGGTPHPNLPPQGGKGLVANQIVTKNRVPRAAELFHHGSSDRGGAAIRPDKMKRGVPMG